MCGPLHLYTLPGQRLLASDASEPGRSFNESRNVISFFLPSNKHFQLVKLSVSHQRLKYPSTVVAKHVINKKNPIKARKELNENIPLCISYRESP